MFNGISRAYEIKTELDSDKRLGTQLADYKKIFQRCFVVVHDNCVGKYINADDDIGIISMCVNRGNVKFEEVKAPKDNHNIDPHILIRCLRSSEYKELVKRYYRELPEMNAFTAFSIPFLTVIGFAPAATFFNPSLIKACANNVAVVVPSPAISFVFVATSLTN
jgi:hypothetical protein